MRVLIVDDEIDITEIIEFLVLEKFPLGTSTVLASSGNKAIEIINGNDDIGVCICDHNMPDGMGMDVIRHLIQVKSKIKFVLCSTVIPSDRPMDYPTNYVFSSIQKPDISGGVDRLLNLIENNFIKKPLTISESYIPISLHILSLIGSAPADIYIRMSDNKFLKCINGSEKFTPIDKQKYSDKLITELYLKKGAHVSSMKQIILKAVQEIMERRNLPLVDKMGIAHSQILGLIKFTGITPELAEATKQNVQQSVDFMIKSPVVADFWKQKNFLGEYPSQLYTLHSLLASVVLKKLQWSSEATIYKLTLASFLQDISLDSIPLMEICDYQDFLDNESRFSDIEIKKYNEHPFVSSEIAASFNELPTDIERILLEQHEMPDGSGFPRKLNSEQLGPLSCVFILTGIFARHVLRQKTHFDIIIFNKYLEDRGYSRGNFKEVFKVVESLNKI